MTFKYCIYYYNSFHCCKTTPSCYWYYTLVLFSWRDVIQLLCAVKKEQNVREMIKLWDRLCRHCKLML